MAKRSPISGYNHNVRYRGLIFHVQTEDSGVMSPHLFTHLFREGVIISTRKLVYDAGSDEGAIKSLMQAQHKAVLKDLRKGTFDDKIDAYLGDVPGLLPRGAADPGEDVGTSAEVPTAVATGSSAEITPPPPPVSASAGPPAPEEDVPTLVGDAAAAVAAAFADKAFELGPPGANTRTITNSVNPAMTAIAPPTVRTTSTSYPEIEIVAGLDDGLADIEIEPSRERNPRDTDVEMPVDPRFDSLPRTSTPGTSLPSSIDASPTVPTSAISDGVPPLLPSNGPGWATARTQSPTAPPTVRSPNIGAASLPPIPVRSPTRPPAPGATPSRAAMPVPVVMSRAVSPQGQAPASGNDDERARTESDAAEVYSPAPPSVEAPPGIGGERPGQYAQHKRPRIGSGQSEPIRTGPVAIPAGLGRPPRIPLPVRARPPTADKTEPTTTIRTPIPPPGKTEPPRRPPTLQPNPPGATGSPSSPSSQSGSQPIVQPRPASISISGQLPVQQPRAVTPEPVPPRPTSPRPVTPEPVPPSASASYPAIARSRTPTPVRVQPQSRPHVSSGGVVMSRPAVIVGAPARTSTSQTRVRKAREDEGRGFGQGLISEKSLDEVILAYLSEDGDDK